MASALAFSGVIFEGSMTEEEILNVIKKILPAPNPVGDNKIRISTIDLFCMISWLIYNQPAFLQDEDNGQAMIKRIIEEVTNIFMSSFDNEPKKILIDLQACIQLLPEAYSFCMFEVVVVPFTETIHEDYYIEAIASLKLYLNSYKKEIYTNNFIANLCNTLNFLALPSFHNIKVDGTKLLQDFVPDLFLPTVAFDRKLSERIILIYSIMQPVPRKIKKNASEYAASKIYLQQFKDRMTVAYMHDVEHQRKVKEHQLDDLLASMNEAESREAIIRKTQQHQEAAEFAVRQREEAQRQREMDELRREEEEQSRAQALRDQATERTLLCKHWENIPALIQYWQTLGELDDIPTRQQLNAIHKQLRKTFHPDKVQDEGKKAQRDLDFKQIEIDFSILLAYTNCITTRTK